MSEQNTIANVASSDLSPRGPRKTSRARRTLHRTWTALLLGTVACSSGTSTLPSDDTDDNGITPDSEQTATDPEQTTPSDSEETTTLDPGDDDSEDPTSEDDDPGDDDPTLDPTLKFDVSVPDVMDDGCNEGDSYNFSIIWVANSEQGTVSKIDTETAVELARYRTGPTADVDPSRTSVNLQGAVAVANRTGSVTLIAAREQLCVDRNGDGKIQTSTGPTQVLPWGEDECVLWHHDLGFTPPVNSMDNQGGPRALAWDVGEMTDDPCEEPRPHLWVGWRDQPKPDALIRKIDIEGNTVDEVRITNWLGNWNHGIYGGAIDPEGNFWGLGTLGTLIRVDGETMDVKRWDYSDGRNQIPYGIAIDGNGDVWLGGYQRGRLIHFDPKTEMFSLMPQATGGPQIMRGLMADRENRLWIAGNNLCGVSHFDITKKQWVDPLIPLPECVEPVGISIDAKGFVWIVDREAQRAYKMDPMTKATSVVMGLVKPYTYSDMTGAGLKLVEDPPG